MERFELLWPAITSIENKAVKHRSVISLFMIDTIWFDHTKSKHRAKIEI